MSFPSIPDVDPNINLEREDMINLLLASVAFEELGLAHIINAEGEKIQAALNFAETNDDLIEINRSVERTLRSTIKKEMLLQFKLEDILEAIPEIPPDVEVISNTATVQGFFNDISVTATDTAHYSIQKEGTNNG